MNSENGEADRAIPPVWVAIWPGVIWRLWAKAWMPNLNCST